MSVPACIDLLHLDLEGAIACYLLDAEEPTIVDPGPSTTLDRLIQQLDSYGIGSADLRHIMLTHIHLDHSGATGHLVERFPGVTVHVHKDATTHMVNPERLVASTRRTFGDSHDRLWGDVKPVPPGRINSWGPGDPGPWKGLRPESTPGHISHHVAYLDERDGMLFAGDSMGIVLSGSPPYGATPPPAVDLKAWHETLEEIRIIGPECFAATHFGFRSDVESCRIQFKKHLQALEDRVRACMRSGDESDMQAFGQEVRDELEGFLGMDKTTKFLEVFPPATDWAGVAFYLERNS